MPCPSVDISDQTLDAIGVWTARVLKVVVLVGSVVSMAGFLALIFTTVAPPTSNEPDLPYEESPFESHLVPQEK
ncbi:hypothetical protein DIPPA_31445 [Diplonema papillatum]|nr:hypothetical protein DIPPA_31445 [Diplonema papillatum]